MYENERSAMVGAQDIGKTLIDRDDRTIGENIDARIANMEREIAALRETKAKLERGVALTDMKPSELRRAMNF